MTFQPVKLDGYVSSLDLAGSKSPKLPGTNFPAITRSDLKPPICVASISLGRSPRRDRDFVRPVHARGLQCDHRRSHVGRYHEDVTILTSHGAKPGPRIIVLCLPPLANRAGRSFFLPLLADPGRAKQHPKSPLDLSSDWA
jgi:hypothetical protein